MNQAALAELVRDAAVEVVRAKGLDPAGLPATVTVARPRNSAHGDYATNLPLQAAAGLGVRPAEFARWLSAALGARAPVAAAETADPGFVNVRLSAAAHAELLAEVLRAGDGYGGSEPRFEQPDPAAFAELAGRIGADAASYALRCSSVDIARFARQTNENPVFYLQYAHARLAAVLRGAGELGIDVDSGFAAADFELLTEDREGELIRTIADYPDVLHTAAELGEPHRAAKQLEALATAYHRFVETHRVLPQADDRPDRRTTARLGLCAAARQVLANGLGQLGIAAPERI